MTRIIYRVLLWLSLPAVLVRLEWRARREPEYGERIGERMGQAPARIPADCIWFHAVSAGETIAVAPLIAELASEFRADHAAPILVTTMTPTGSAEVTRRLGSAVHHCYAPYDFRFAVRWFFDRVRPRLLVLVETELWPNLIDEAHRRGVPVLLVNARMSGRSARGYGIIRRLTRSMLRQVRFVACQYHDHLQRFRALGLPGERGDALGNVKFDARLPEDHDERVAALRQQLGLGQAKVWVAGSTHPGEDELVLDAHVRVRERYPESRLLLAPRHPVRGKDVSALTRHRGFTVLRLGSTARGQTDNRVDDAAAPPQPTSEFNQHPAADADASRMRARTPSILRGAPPRAPRLKAPRVDLLSSSPAVSSGARGHALRRLDAQATKVGETCAQKATERLPDSGEPAQVIVCDIMGQLQPLYGLSHVAFLGGSLVPAGGHNPIEPALCSQPLAMGPHTFNFEEVVAAFAAAQCLTRVETPAQLADAVIAAFGNDAARTAAGARALQVVNENRGATERLLDLLRSHIRVAIG